MSAVVARALVALAARSLGGDRRDWGMAMEAEFEAAVEDGRPLAFAAGCLLGAWRGLPAREEGRFLLASHMLALGFLLPLAAALICGAVGGLPVPEIALLLERPAFAADPGMAFMAVPSLAALSLFLGCSHLLLAWVMLERDWARVTRLATFNAAASATLVAVAGALFLTDVRFLLQAAVLVVELAAVAALAQWHAELTPEDVPLLSSA